MVCSPRLLISTDQGSLLHAISCNQSEPVRFAHETTNQIGMALVSTAGSGTTAFFMNIHTYIQYNAYIHNYAYRQTDRSTGVIIRCKFGLVDCVSFCAFSNFGVGSA